MRIACSVHGESLRFKIEEWDETDDDSVVYRVSTLTGHAFIESPRVEGVDALAELGVAALYIDGMANVTELDVVK